MNTIANYTSHPIGTSDIELLPESEKEYNRNTAMETLKVIEKLGFEIRKKKYN